MECIFCKIIKKEIPAKIIVENKGAVAFLDVNPMSDGHTVVVPKKHILDLSHCDQDALHDVFDLVREVSLIIQDSSLKPWGFNYLSNEAPIAGQVVMHFHVHVIPKYGKEEGFKISIGHKYLDDVNKVYTVLLKTKPKKKS